MEFSIAHLEQLSGVSMHTIRMWERRYRALTPARSAGNTRSYGEDQLRRLLNIVSLQQSGSKISGICSLSDAEIDEALKKEMDNTISADLQYEYYISQLISFGLGYDEVAIDHLLSRCLLDHDMIATYKNVIYPMLVRLGLMWRRDSICPSQEHFLSGIIRQKIFAAIDGVPLNSKNKSSWLLFLPEDEDHDIGLLMANYILRLHGHQVIYLGAKVPLTAVKNAMMVKKADHILLFMVRLRPVTEARSYIDKLQNSFGDTPVHLAGNNKLLSEIEVQQPIKLFRTLNEFEQSIKADTSVNERLKNEHAVAVIGSGFAGLSAAAYAGAAGCSVTVYEKNKDIGGRARQLKTANGYIFDMGPSWYWMPEVFERFFNDFGHKASDFYELELLDPGFSIVFDKNEVMDIPADFDSLCKLFESIEAGSSTKLRHFLDEAAFKYRVGMEKLVYKPGLSLLEFIDGDLIKGVFKLQVFTSFSKHVKKFFKDPRLIALMEFPVLFLGAMPEDTPALYSLMNYAGLKLGTWYPKGGFGRVVEAMRSVAESQGTRFYTDEPVSDLIIENQLVSNVVSLSKKENYDGVIAAADYHHIEKNLLNNAYGNYDEKYWDKRVMAPSCLIFYMGVSTKVNRLKHHTLFFDEDLKQHAIEIYKQPQWPSKPLFYVCCPSKTDDSVAPAGHENLFILMPLAPGVEDTEILRERYFELMMRRLENFTGDNIRGFIDYKKSYCVTDFTADYNSYKGNAYGLANTLMQTANLKPSIRNKKVTNLFYAGQLTVPGPGVPPSIISGNVAAQQLVNYLKSKK